MEGLKKEELVNILKYSYWMSRIIAPISAEKIGLELAGFDEISDFYKEIIDKIEKNEKIDLSNKSKDNEFLKLVYDSMKKDVEHKDIEYDGMFYFIEEQD